FLQNANGPDNVWRNNNAYVNKSIKTNAGVRSPYKYLLKEVVVDSNWPLQEVPHFAAIELIDKKFDSEKIKALAKTNGVIGTQLYQWKNHTVLYGKMNHIEYLKAELALEYPKAEIKTYNTPLYNFDRSERCNDKTMASEWEHILLTANLVENESLQNEYIEHHNTQFQKWPEVAQGFCNANFQQLQVFKNERQLLLVISIPKGESLDELNPKTTEGNPRVDQWNTLMKKYQTGIKGTKPNETWVLLTKLN
ncbi:MAG: L-rhamnose mutarotase, partial [Flavobacteriaceae bacterium]